MMNSASEMFVQCNILSFGELLRSRYLLFEDEFSPVVIQSYNVWLIQWRLWCQMFGNGGVPHYTLVM